MGRDRRQVGTGCDSDSSRSHDGLTPALARIRREKGSEFRSASSNEQVVLRGVKITYKIVNSKPVAHHEHVLPLLLYVQTFQSGQDKLCLDQPKFRESSLSAYFAVEERHKL